MNQERDLARTHIAPSAPAHDDDLAPGRGSRSSQMDAPARPLVGGLLQRKARDTNGVADGADAAVASAASSAGSSLPEPIMRKFESSLGTDLSSVRIHTGGESASAAQAVGARAYTMGHDIHFGAGQYDPSSEGGQHLLAHEVAHTVQQRGGAPTRQNKLMISSPSDAFELEADRAASSMVAGHHFALGTSPVVIARNPNDTPDKDKPDYESGTMSAHREEAESFRRWTGEDRSEGEIVHGGAALRPALPRPEAEARLVDFTLQARITHKSLVPADFVQRVLNDRAQPQYGDVLTLFNDIVTAAGTDTFMLQMGTLEQRAPELLRLIETHFIRDPGVSGLDVLGANAAQYRDFAWKSGDYPGGPAGPNEGLADRMHGAMSEVRPERRANSGPDAVITRSQFESSARIRAFITAHLQPVPAFSAAPAGSTVVPTQPPGKQLLEHALTSFLLMRDAALVDGVPLAVTDGFRSTARAAANAAASGNPAAVASFSSHSLGLAMDLIMSMGSQHFVETTTKPMQNVVDMRTSPVHRWMLLHGAEHGWFPYTPEPWHWEYNPPGFRDQLMREINPPAAPEVPANQST